MYGQEDDNGEASRAAALAELKYLRNIDRAAQQCRDFGGSETAWYVVVHGPLLMLGLERYGSRVRRELATTAAIADPFSGRETRAGIRRYINIP